MSSSVGRTKLLPFVVDDGEIIIITIACRPVQQSLSVCVCNNNILITNGAAVTYTADVSVQCVWAAAVLFIQRIYKVADGGENVINKTDNDFTVDAAAV